MAAMRNATPVLADATLYVVYCVLVVATVGAIARRRHSGSWVGFAAIGWAYFLPVFVFGSPGAVTNLPTNKALVAYISSVQEKPVPPMGIGIVERDNATITYSHGGKQPPESFLDLVDRYNSLSRTSLKVGHLLVTLVFGLLGSMLGERMSGRRSGNRADRPC
jgi:hypothetical protein